MSIALIPLSIVATALIVSYLWLALGPVVALVVCLLVTFVSSRVFFR